MSAIDNNNTTKYPAWLMTWYFDTPSIEFLHEIDICADEIAILVGGGDGDGDQLDAHDFYVSLVNPMSLLDLKRAWGQVMDLDGDSKTPCMQKCKNNFRKDSRYVREDKKYSNAWLHEKASAEELSQFRKPATADSKKRPIAQVVADGGAAVPPPLAKKTKTLSGVELAVRLKLETYPTGVVAPVLAKAMGLDRTAVNRALYNLEKINVAVKGFDHAGGSSKPVWRRGSAPL
jgi:hypothetical protein